jgi:hypothetical protein
MQIAAKKAIVNGNPIPKNQFKGGEKRSNKNNIERIEISSPGIIIKFLLKANSMNVRQIHDTSTEVSA